MKSKLLGGLAVSAAGILGIALPAFAATSGTFSLSTTGVQFNSGSYVFGSNTANCNPQTGFTYSGNLKDNAADGNSVFVHAKVAGFGYATRVYNSGGNGTSVPVGQLITGPGDCYENTANVQACQDRGTLFPDLCDDQSFTR